MRQKPKWTRFDEIISGYLASAEFQKLRDGTRYNWRLELLFAGRVIGGLRQEDLTVPAIREFLDGIADWPGKQQVSLKAIRAAEKWALERGRLIHPITYGIKLTAKIGSHTPWTDEQADIAERCVSPRLVRAIVLMRHTGQRGSDIVRMGWSDIKTIRGLDWIHIRQQKTGREVFCPISEPLARAMASWEKTPGPFCRDARGRPFVRKQLSESWNYERETNPDLSPLRQAGLVLHGLRGHACVRLYRAGHTTREVSILVGMSLNMVEHYCKLSRAEDDAVAAVVRLHPENKAGFSNAGLKKTGEIPQ